MNQKDKIKACIKTLKYLHKFNIGDKYEDRILKTLIQTGNCPHVYNINLNNKCLYCNQPRSVK